MFDRLIDTLLGAIHLFQFWVVVAAYERGVVLRLGILHREIGPGLHWLIPLGFDRVWCEHTVPRTMNRASSFRMPDENTHSMASGL